MEACRYNPREHVLIHPQLETSLRSHLPDDIQDNAFVYFHRITRNYVIAWWAKKGKSFVDCFNLGESLQNMTKEDFHNTIRAMVKCDSKKRLVRRLKRKRNAYLKEQQDKEDFYQSLAEDTSKNKKVLGMSG